jgi:hypothetical protein
MNDYVKEVEAQNEALRDKLAFFENIIGGEFVINDLKHLDVKLHGHGRENILNTYINTYANRRKQGLETNFSFISEHSHGNAMERAIFFFSLIQWVKNFPYHAIAEFHGQETPVALIKIGNNPETAVSSKLHRVRGISSIFYQHTDAINKDIAELIETMGESPLDSVRGDKDNIAAVIIGNRSETTQYENVVQFIHFHFGKETNIIQTSAVTDGGAAYIIYKSMHGLPIKIGLFQPFLVSSEWISSSKDNMDGSEPVYMSKHSYASRLTEFTKKIIVK